MADDYKTMLALKDKRKGGVSRWNQLAADTGSAFRDVGNAMVFRGVWGNKDKMNAERQGWYKEMGADLPEGGAIDAARSMINFGAPAGLGAIASGASRLAPIISNAVLPSNALKAGYAATELGDVGIPEGINVATNWVNRAKNIALLGGGLTAVDASSLANNVLSRSGQGKGTAPAASTQPQIAATESTAPLTINSDLNLDNGTPTETETATDPNAVPDWVAKEGWKVSGKGGVTPSTEQPTAVRITPKEKLTKEQRAAGINSDLLEAQGFGVRPKEEDPAIKAARDYATKYPGTPEAGHYLGYLGTMKGNEAYIKSLGISEKKLDNETKLNNARIDRLLSQETLGAISADEKKDLTVFKLFGTKNANGEMPDFHTVAIKAIINGVPAESFSKDSQPMVASLSKVVNKLKADHARLHPKTKDETDETYQLRQNSDISTLLGAQ